MIILLDTNVVLDYLLKRKGFDEASEIIDLAISEMEYECITASTITDIHYISTMHKNEAGDKDFDSYKVQDMLADLLNYIDIISVSEKDITAALKMRWKDFEDAVQYSVALANDVDCIVTNNVKDFEKAEIDIMTPTDFLEQYISKSKTR